MTRAARARANAYAFAKRAAALAAAWWILAEGGWDSPLIAAACVCAAAAASLAVHGPQRVHWRPLRVPRLALYFMRQSLAGGWDVARRALAPAMPVQPAVLRFELTLPAGFPRVLFVWLVSLTPGTAAVSLTGATLNVHALDVTLPIEGQLRELESRIAALFARS